MTAARTHAEATRHLVARYDAAGDTPQRIAERLGITVQRVERILDELDVPQDTDGAAAGQPPPATVSPIRPARTTQPAPVPTKSTPRPVRSSPEPVKPALRPAAQAPAAPTGLLRVHGSRRGYQQHYRFKEKPCQDCKDAWNTSQAEKRAAARSLEATVAPPPPPAGGPVFRPGGVLPSRPPQPVTVRPTVQVRWLVPRGEQLPAATRIEYAIQVGAAGGLRIVSDATAELEADSGLTVFRRLVTDWVEVTG